MKQLLKVVELIANKYIRDVSLILEEDKLILQYMYTINNERDVYKIMELTESRNNYIIKFQPEGIIKVINIQELEEILEVLKKQSNHKKTTQEEINVIKSKYIKGTKVRLIKMYDYINSVPVGTKGTITNVDDLGTLHIKWKNGSTLGLVVGVDEFEIIKE